VLDFSCRICSYLFFIIFLSTAKINEGPEEDMDDITFDGDDNTIDEVCASNILVLELMNRDQGFIRSILTNTPCAMAHGGRDSAK